MNLGHLDKRVRVESKSITRNGVDNSEVIAWELVRYWRVTIKDVAPARAHMERDESGIRMGTSASEVRGRWFPGLTSNMRLVRTDDRSERVMNILNVSEIGKREGWLCVVETYTTEGQGG